MKSNKFPFKIGDKVRYIGVDGWHKEDETLVVSYSELPDRGYTWCVNDDYCSDIISVSWEDFELIEPVPQKHIHYDMIVEWAANPSEVIVEYFDNVDMCWKYIEKPTLVSSCQYRFKPEEPERVFPTTSLTKSEIFSIFTTNNGVKDLDAGLKAVADGAIMRYIRDEEEE